jgi:hypothetical protein
MKTEIRPVETKQDLDMFIGFPWKIYKDDPNWVPPEAPVLAEIRARRAALQAQREAKAS